MQDTCGNSENDEGDDDGENSHTDLYTDSNGLYSSSASSRMSSWSNTYHSKYAMSIVSNGMSIGRSEMARSAQSYISMEESIPGSVPITSLLPPTIPNDSKLKRSAIGEYGKQRDSNPAENSPVTMRRPRQYSISSTGSW
jgi:hypothetical protein